MTIDEAILHTEEVAQEKRYEYQECVAVHDMEEAMNCEKCGEEHAQLAEWLKDYKRLLEQEPCGDCVSRQQALKELKESAEHHANDSREEVLLRRDRDIIRALPPVTPTRKVGKWIRTDYWYSNYCPFCNHKSERTNFCPNCGADMREKGE